MSDVYARRALGRLKVGYTECLPVAGSRDPYLRDVFWHRSGDQVTESNVQARLCWRPRPPSSLLRVSDATKNGDGGFPVHAPAHRLRSPNPRAAPEGPQPAQSPCRHQRHTPKCRDTPEKPVTSDLCGDQVSLKEPHPYTSVDTKKSALVVVDVQNGFVTENAAHVVPVIVDLVRRWQAVDGHVVFTRYHNYPGSPYERLIGWYGLYGAPETDLVSALIPFTQRSNSLMLDKTGYTAFTDVLMRAGLYSRNTDLLTCSYAGSLPMVAY
jgi:hypothetical protein